MTDARVGESGKEHRINVQFDMSSNTSIDFVYQKPRTGDLLEVPGVLGTTQETIDGVVVAANFWASYEFKPTDLNEAGTWNLQITYNNTSVSPVDVFKNLSPIQFIVGA